MKVLVTGGAGFIGSHLVDAYLERGDEVVIVDDLSAGRESNIAGAVKKGAKFVKLDLRSPHLASFLQSENPDLINHHAAQKSVRDSVSDPRNDADINLMGLLSLLEAARSTRCRNILFASSGGAIYGEQLQFPATEEHPKNPLSPYGISKLSSELYLHFYARQYGFRVGSLRYSNVYGPRQDPEGEAGVIAIFCSQLRAEKQITIYGSGEQTRDFVFVADVVAANLLVDKFLTNFHVWNIATEQETSVLQLYHLLNEISGNSGSYQLLAAQPGEQMRSVLSYAELKQRGWSPKIPLRAGLESTFQAISSAAI